ncbi:Nif3-like dinuclear metal center hexameric protein [Anaerococcus sp.]|uniref:Nif3-like dinuclear metal center hexameric protein n=1 Tax=Anaerococcus sp. TaxID=1872515 RepID=UPI0028FF5B7A|nr:Nif3-like dinuclear metal center hexameric protein [Anaerococcus sp.]MDU1828971.1 Nif3-like dinuclear metal center hexameric protein [Anaerococcus sp.]
MEIKELIDRLCDKYPLDLQENWDNSGLQIGNLNNELENVLISLDLEDEGVDMAIKNKCNLIITHHPYLFNGTKSIDFSDDFYNRLDKVIKNDISVFAMHTNLDIAKDGLNDNLCEILNIKNTNILEVGKEIGLGRYGHIDKIKALDFAKKVKDVLVAEKLICYGNMGKEIEKVAVCGGAGQSLFEDAFINECDLMITGDVSYHMAMDYTNRGLIIIDAGHFASENHVIYKLEKVIYELIDKEIYTYSKEDTFRTFI